MKNEGADRMVEDEAERKRARPTPPPAVQEEEEEEDPLDPAKGVVLKGLSFLNQVEGFGMRDGYGITKPESEREDSLKPGIRVLPGRRLPFTVAAPARGSPGQHRVTLVAQVRPYGEKVFQHMAVDLVFKVRDNCPARHGSFLSELFKAFSELVSALKYRA